MCKTSLHPLLKSLPKIEHHLHIEGTLEPSLLFELAEKNNISLPKDDEAYKSIESLVERYTRFTSLDDFLPYYYNGMQTLVTSQDYERLAWAYLTRFASDGGVHAEIFFDGLEHVNRNVPLSTVISGLNAARQRAQAELGVTSELICCFLRHLPVQDSVKSFQSLEFQEAVNKGDVTGIGLDSTELNNPPHLWKEIYDLAAAKSLRRTAHAGEEGSADFVRNALEHLGVERIDHGIRLADDEELMHEVARQGTLLTVCPISNVVLKCKSTLKEVPIRKFLDAGISFSINSDDPAYFGGTYILDNYCAVQEAFELTPGEWGTIVRTAIEKSWCNDSRKQELVAKLEEVLSSWNS